MFDEDTRTRQEIKRLSKQVKKQPLLFARLGECYFRLGDPDHAEPILKRGLEEYPDYLSGLLILGEVYLYKGFLRDAEDCVHRGLSKNPQHLGLLQLMLRLQKSLEDEREVRRVRSLIKNLDPLHISEDLDEEEAKVFREEGEDEDQPAGLPSSASIWKMKAAARQKRETEAAAQSDQFEQTGLETAPETTPALDNVLNEIIAPALEGSASELEIAEVEPEPPPEKNKIITKTLGEIYARQNKFDEAVEIYGKLTELHPEDESYRKRLEELKSCRESFLESQKDLQHG